MAIQTEDTDKVQSPPKQRLGWLREQQEAIRARGKKPFEFTPIHIDGESLSETIIRERRGDFDDPVS